MTPRSALIAPALLLLGAAAHAQQMEISPSASRETRTGPESNFTGTVHVEPLFAPNEHRTGGGHVEFSAGARSNWHSHPAGQTLVVTSGTGWVQEEGGDKLVIKVGDVIWTPPGVKHWHGATADTSMSHMTITGAIDGKNVEWLEPVTDAQYR